MREQRKVSRIIEVACWKSEQCLETTNTSVSPDGSMKVEVHTSTVVSRLTKSLGKIVYCRSTDHDRARYFSGYHLVMTEDLDFLEWLGSMGASSSSVGFYDVNGKVMPYDSDKLEIVSFEWDESTGEDVFSSGFFQNLEEVEQAYKEVIE